MNIIPNNLTIITMIILWVFLCVISQLFNIIILLLIAVALILYFIAYIIIYRPFKILRQKHKDSVEIDNIHNQRLLSLDDESENNKEYTEQAYISNVNPKFVYYHNKSNDSITLLNRDNGNLWLIQPSNRNKEYPKYKLKYQRTDKAIDMIEELLANDEDYFEKDGLLLTSNYYLENKILPGNFT